MKTITPITTWINGVEQQADGFSMVISWDNMSNSASFSYQLVKIDNTFDPMILVNGNLNIQGDEYQTWDADPSANEWAYNWAASKLNLTITGDYVPPTPPEPVAQNPIEETPITE